nr:MAG TPA: hypothetical protein [Caudoviricetes sp.]
MLCNSALYMALLRIHDLSCFIFFLIFCIKITSQKRGPTRPLSFVVLYRL